LFRKLDGFIYCSGLSKYLSYILPQAHPHERKNMSKKIYLWKNVENWDQKLACTRENHLRLILEPA